MMDSVNITGLEVREAINIGIGVFSFVLCILFLRYAFREWNLVGYNWMGWPAKAAVGLFFLSLGELIRSVTVWEIIHYRGTESTYATDIGPLLVALLFVTVGALCCIRVFTPDKWGHWLWVGSLAVFLMLLVANWTVFA